MAANLWGRIRRDGWLIVLLALLVAVCLLPQSEGGASAQEQRMAQVLSAIEGAGRVTVCVSPLEDGQSAAVIVAEGAGDLAVQLRLTRAAMTLLDTPAEHILVCRMKEESR